MNVLDFSNNFIGNGVFAIGKAIESKNINQLIEINLSNNKIKIFGISLNAGLPYLKILKLDFNEISDEGALCIAENFLNN